MGKTLLQTGPNRQGVTEANFTIADFTENEALNASIEEIMFRWAGVDDVDPGSRGPVVDARHLEFLEKFFAESFIQQGFTTPFDESGALIEDSWRGVFQYVKANLLVQVGAEDLFGGTATYNVWTGAIEGSLNLDETAIEDLVNEAPSPGPENIAYWIAITEFLDTVKGLDNYTTDENTWLNDAVHDSDSNLTWDDIKDTLAVILTGSSEGDNIAGTNSGEIINGGSGDDTITGYQGNDVIYGGSGHDNIDAGWDDDVIFGEDGNDTIIGDSGNDHLYGGSGSDTLDGGNGDDILEGGTGGNLLYGSYGDDQYVFGGGDDLINEYGAGSTDDQIIMLANIDANDLTFSRVSSSGSTTYFYDLLITINTGGSIQIKDHFYGSDYGIETLVFDDTSTIDLTALAGYETYLTDGDDYYGPSLSSDDIVHGGKGDDYINTWSGNDTLDGGDGNDTLEGREGDDTYIASAGFDIINDADGADQIVIPASIDPESVYYYRVADASGYYFNDLRIYVPGLGQIQISSQFYSAYTAVESLHFLYDDSTVILSGQTIETRGGTGNDSLNGDALGASTSDILNGQEGDDFLAGGYGNDAYVFSEGHDSANDTGGIDTIDVRDGYAPSDVTLSRVSSGGLAPYDELRLTDTGGNTIQFTGHFSSSDLSVEYIHFQNGTTWDLSTLEIAAQGTSGSDSISGVSTGDASNADTIYGYAGDDYLYGGDGNDVIYGGNDNDNVIGDNGNDLLDGGSGNDYIDGGADNDTVTYASAASAVTVNLATTTAQNTNGAGTDTLANIENLIGSAYNDTLTGDGNANVIEGGAGNDTINGAGGTDTVSYEHAASAVTVNLATTTGQNTGGAGTDTITNTENLRGSAFNDTLTGSSGNNVIEGGAGNDTMNAQGGTDTLTYANAAGAITVSLALTSAQVTGGAGTDTVSNFENLTGSAFGDTLTGSTAANVINGGDGNDIIEGGAGNDTLVGGNGLDTVSFAGAASATTFNLATTSGQNTVSSGTDTVSGFENILGSAFNDTLTGNSSANVIEGGAGNDTMNGSGGTDTVSYASAASAVTVNLATTTGQNTGGAGTDTLSSFEWLIGSGFNDTLTGSTAANNIYGGAGNDTISGGNGNDILYGGAGTDTLTGGANADTFVFEAASAFANQDTITDFSTANADKIDLHDILDVAFDPVQNAISDFVNFTNSGANSIMSIDQDGTGTTYGFVNVATLNGVTNLDETTLYNNGNLLAA